MQWLSKVAPHVSLDMCVAEATRALEAGRILATLRCPHCGALHLDSGHFAVRKHITHLCTQCSSSYRISPAVQGNPLAVLGTTLVEGKLMLSRLPG